ncbi:MAG: hypothetical protein GWN47_03200 [Woeseiaceae bacterium]|nr:hypothetical protein [Woeseiaceae bacterium]
MALLVACLAGCKAVDGTFLPGCAAYAGDRIELRNGSFEWDKFTDAIEVDEDGNPVDAFPDYPKRGNYTIDGTRLILAFEEDGSIETFNIHEHDGMGLQLLTDAQLAAMEKGGPDEDCALTKVGRDH